MSDSLNLTISDTDFDPSYVMGDIANYATRIAARGLVVDGENIALLNVSKLGFYKLPGGGVKESETLEMTFKREIMEEVGCDSKIRSSLGEVVEYRDGFKLKQTSHIFVSDLVGEVGSNHLEPDELAEGFEVIWVTPIKAIKLLESSAPTDYEGKFIIKRDLAIINYYLSQVKQFMSKLTLPHGAIHKLPPDFAGAILSDSKVSSLWLDITPLARNEWICWVTSAKLKETRARRIVVGLDKMRKGMRRPCCWEGCPHR